MSEDLNEQSLKNRIITKLIRSRAVGKNRIQKETIQAWVPSRESQAAEDAITELSTSANSPLIIDSNGTVYLESLDAGIEYLKNNSGDVPFGFDTRGRSDDRALETEGHNDRRDLEEEIQNLIEEINSMNEVAADWRSEAKRRQQLSLIFGIGGFILGIVTSFAI